MTIALSALLPFAAEIHQNNVAKGFWPEDKSSRNVGELIGLMHTENDEFLIGTDAYCEKIPEYTEEEEELADLMIRCLDASYGLYGPVEASQFLLLEKYMAKNKENLHIQLGHNLSQALEANRHGAPIGDRFNGIALYLANQPFLPHLRIFDAARAKVGYNTTRPYKHGKQY